MRNQKTRLKPVGTGLTTLRKGSAFTPSSGMVGQQVRMKEAAKVYIKTFSELIEAKGYILQQVFNCDEKRKPNRTYITAEKTMPGHKPMKHRLALALCANASGDCLC